MKKHTILVLFLSLMGFAFNYDKPAYILYNNEGKQILYSNMVNVLKDADMVYFGELHTDPISHWLEFEVTKDLYALKKNNLVMGAEMFESDNQLLMDEYLKGFYAAKKFEAEVKLWGNYKTDYKPLVEFAKDSGIYFVATDIPRRYASMVYKGGFEALDTLSNEAKKLIAPLPMRYDPEIKCYKDMLSMQGMGAHVNENFPKAQAAKDATMAYFAMKNWSKGKLFIHYDGAYHSNNHQGIVWHLLQENPKMNIKTIAVVMQKDVSKLDEENLNLADFIICIPDNMTQTNR